VVLLFWVWFYWYFAKQIFIAIGAISFLGTYGATVLGFLPGGGAAGVGGIAVGAAQFLLYAAAVAVVLYVVLFAFLVLTTIRLPVNGLFMGRCADAVARHYRGAAAPEPIGAGRTTLKQYALLVGGPVHPDPVRLGVAAARRVPERPAGVWVSSPARVRQDAGATAAARPCSAAADAGGG
jgi:hypothetical protein